MEKYVIIYEKVEGFHIVEHNSTYYANDMTEVAIWLQEHTDVIVICIAQVLD